MIIENNTLNLVEPTDIINGTVVIPDNITRIDIGAFYFVESLTSITIPDSVTSIGSSAFSGCTGLTSITIPNSVKSIGRFAFYKCTGLTSITIGSGVTHVDKDAFYGCAGLKNANSALNYKAFIFDKQHNLESKYNHKKYYLGHKSDVRGELTCCENGLHYCTNLFDIFNYYYGDYEKDFVIALCDVSSENVGHKGDSKRCARWIRPTKILTRQELIQLLNSVQNKNKEGGD